MTSAIYSAYDSHNVIQVFNLATNWILEIEKHDKPFPSNFDFNFFFKGIKIALEIDHNNVCGKVLWSVYKIMHYLPFD